MRVKKKRKFRRGGGVFTNPSGMEIPSGWGVKTKKPSVGGGMDIFWNYTFYHECRSPIGYATHILFCDR